MAGCGHGLAGDAVDLVEGVRTQEAVVRCANEQLQGQRLTLHVAVQLKKGRTDTLLYLHYTLTLTLGKTNYITFLGIVRTSRTLKTCIDYEKDQKQECTDYIQH